MAMPGAIRCLTSRSHIKNCLFNLPQTYFKNNVYCSSRKHVSRKNPAVRTMSYSWKSIIFLSLAISIAVAGTSMSGNDFTSKLCAAVYDRDWNNNINRKFSKKISRKVEGPTEATGLELILHQSQSCTHCSKVRAFLGFYGVPYSIVEDNSFIPSKRSPVLLIKDATGQCHELTDSATIVSILSVLLQDPTLPQKSKTGTLKNYFQQLQLQVNKKEKTKYSVAQDDSMLQGSEENNQINVIRDWREWVDQSLVPTIPPNIYGTLPEAQEAFDFYSVSGHWANMYPKMTLFLKINLGTLAMYLKNSQFCDRSDVRQSLYNATNSWIEAVGENRFLGGEKPNLADLEVYGALNSTEGCQAFRDLNSNSRVSTWYSDVKHQVERNSGKSLVPYD